MQDLDALNGCPPAGRGLSWRHFALVAFAPLSLLAVMSLAPVAQDQSYHQFADQRELFGILNFFDVITNLPFALIGLAGLQACRRLPPGPSRLAWHGFFAGIFLVAAGSAYYHWQPGDGALVWDRAPITVGFAALLAALLSEYLRPHVGRAVLWPLLALGLGSVLTWHWNGDLRLYVWLQFMTLAAIPMLMLLYTPRYTHGWLLAVALGCYVLAKLAEAGDGWFFAVNGHLSGHSLKHLLAAAGCYCLVLMLRQRRLNP